MYSVSVCVLFLPLLMVCQPEDVFYEQEEYVSSLMVVELSERGTERGREGGRKGENEVRELTFCYVVRG